MKPDHEIEEELFKDSYEENMGVEKKDPRFMRKKHDSSVFSRLLNIEPNINYNYNKENNFLH